MLRSKPKNKLHLQNLILSEIREHGLNCNLNHIDTSLITNMEGLFFKYDGVGSLNKTDLLNKFNGDISLWDTSKVKDMSFMFCDTEFNNINSISSWDVSNVVTTLCMFRDSKFNQDISSWNISNLIDAESMFYNSKFNQDISLWNTSKLRYISYMFTNSNFSGNITGWDTSFIKLDVDAFKNSPLSINPPF